MFISGHKHILEQALKNTNLNFSRQVLDELHDGMIFPDLACSQFQVSKSKSSVFLTKQENCWIFKLFKIIHGKYYGFSTIYQFQRGALSILHSMGNSIDMPMKKTRNHILNMILGFLDATVHGDHGMPAKTAFWIGVILHIVTDSYPKGHTIRHMFHEKPLEKVNERIGDGPTKKARKQITKVLQVEVKRNKVLQSKESIKKLVHNSLSGSDVTFDVQYYLDTRMKSIYHTYLILHFVHYTEQNARNIKQQYKLSKKIGVHDEDEPYSYDLRSFQCYDYQGAIFHKKHDFLQDVKGNLIYHKRVLPEVSMILELFSLYLNGKINPPDFVKTTFTYIASNTFRVWSKDLNNTPVFPHHGLSNKYKVKQLSKHLKRRGQ